MKTALKVVEGLTAMVWGAMNTYSPWRRGAAYRAEVKVLGNMHSEPKWPVVWAEETFVSTSRSSRGTDLVENFVVLPDCRLDTSHVA